MACVSRTQSFHVSDLPLCAHSLTAAAVLPISVARHQLSAATKCRWSVDVIDDDDGHPRYLVDSAEVDTTLTQDPRRGLRHKIFPLIRVE
jgi:hypothetical protein